MVVFTQVIVNPTTRLRQGPEAGASPRTTTLSSSCPWSPLRRRRRPTSMCATQGGAPRAECSRCSRPSPPWLNELAPAEGAAASAAVAAAAARPWCWRAGFRL
eukprot:TRINITY_DN20359_c0_g1_i1.p3 TRINITY_DN20359_c0_g1~~TRINITY_DN20359_c0_g1_i1.p3  ORF type:complete len:103 (+),score=5.81 TRINITY_DN20359_c0_g1_i1:469-777(+)